MKIVPTYLDAALQSGFKLRTSSWQAKTDPLDNGDPLQLLQNFAIIF